MKNVRGVLTPEPGDRMVLRAGDPAWCGPDGVACLVVKLAPSGQVDIELGSGSPMRVPATHLHPIGATS